MRTVRRAPLEVPVAKLEGAAPLERVHHLLEQLLVLGERFLAAADDEHELAAEILEPLGMEGVAAQVVDEVVHALLVARPLEELGEARPDAAGDERGDRDALLSARHLRAVRADVQASFPLLPHERNVAADRLELPVDRGVADSEERAGVVAGDLPAGEERRDELRRSFDGAEPSFVLPRHDPQRII
ncbi:MAG: hypothetical protein ACJ79O_04960 [Myxococcales bacterium]